MYRESDFQACLASLVGWRQNDNPDYPNLPPSLTMSRSGLYFQDEHALITLENIDQCFKNYDKYNFAAYAIGTTYASGNRVRYTDGNVYESLQSANIGNNPTDANSPWWSPVSLLALKLQQLTSAAATKMLSRIFVEKKMNQVTKSIFENIQLFDGAGSLTNKELGQSRFVGFEIFLKDNKDLVTIIRRVGTQFSQANPDFKLYIFHSSQIAPILSLTMALAKAMSFEWTPVLDGAGPVTLAYLNDNYSVGGSFYIGYYESDLVGQAINRGYDFGVAPSYCSTCNNNWKYWSSWSEYVVIQPFTVSNVDLPDPVDGVPQLWDINRNNYAFTKNFGLNLDLTVKCDVTDFLCRENTLFADVMMKQVCVDVLNLIAFSTRNNVIAKETQQMAIFELGNKDNNTPGANTRFEKSLKAMSFDISDMNDACLPCDNKYGSNWSSV